jgi:hypothetical protein
VTITQPFGNPLDHQLEPINSTKNMRKSDETGLKVDGRIKKPTVKAYW